LFIFDNESIAKDYQKTLGWNDYDPEAFVWWED
jgi:hypothetical protein